MVITFVEKRRRLRYLIPALVIIILITVLVWWRGFFAEKGPAVSPVIEVEVSTPKIEIDFATLKNPLLEELQPLEPIPALEGEVGRENPFIPY